MVGLPRMLWRYSLCLSSLGKRGFPVDLQWWSFIYPRETQPRLSFHYWKHKSFAGTICSDLVLTQCRIPLNQLHRVTKIHGMFASLRWTTKPRYQNQPWRLFSRAKANSTACSYIPLSYDRFLKTAKLTYLCVYGWMQVTIIAIPALQAYTLIVTIAQSLLNKISASRPMLSHHQKPCDLSTPEISNSSTQFAICETSPAGSDNQTYNTC